MLPLTGLTILAVSQYGAGPFGTLHLADLGADVIKIEDRRSGGDISRYVPPYHEGTDSLFYQTFNRNKRSVVLDLHNAMGQEVFHKLVTKADVVFNNLKGDQPEKLGLTYEALSSYNERIVCCSLSGFGLNGPRRSQPGYDYLIQGMAGFMSLTGEPDAPPAKAGVSVVDYASGFVGALAIMAGVYQAKVRGVGCNLDVSLFDTALSMLNYLATWNINEGFIPTRIPNSGHPTLVPSQNFKTKDGWIVIMCNKEKFWTALCQKLERDDLAEDSRFRTFDDRYVHREELVHLLSSVLQTKSTREWLSILGDDVPCAPVNTLEEALRDPQVAAREMVVDVPHPKYEQLKEMGCPIKVTGESFSYKTAPDLGADTREVLKELAGLTDAEVDALIAQGAASEDNSEAAANHSR